MLYEPYYLVMKLVPCRKNTKVETQHDHSILESKFLSILDEVSSGSIELLKKGIAEFDLFEAGSTDQNEAWYYSTTLQATLDYWTGECSTAKSSFNELLSSEINVSDNVIGFVNMMAGGNYRSLGEYEDAAKHLLIASKQIDPKSKLITYAMYANYQMGEIHLSLKDYGAAEKSFLEGIALSSGGKSEVHGLFRLHSGLGGVYMKERNYEESHKHFVLAKNIASTDGQKARVFYDLAKLELARGNYESAKGLALQSYQLRNQNELTDAASTSLILFGEIQLQSNLIDEAIKSFEEALSIAVKYKARAKEMQLHRLLSKAFELKEDPKASLKNLKKHLEIAEQINSKQQREIYKLKNAEIALQKKELEVAHKEIKDSIAYAKRIQSALLPPLSSFTKSFASSFVLYLPKDIVAGDFYWLERIKDGVLFAAADCTGHGVPGAMVSVICNNALNRSVREFGLDEPRLILDKTREMVVKEFEKSQEEVKDGMDIALCKLVGNQLIYAGANNSLWVIRRGANVVEEIKALKQPVGNYPNPLPFTSHSLELKTGDTFYVFSDGYADQFGGSLGKKFKTSNLKKLLVSIQAETMQEQKAILEKAFTDWKENEEQVDDVCFIGIQI